MLHAVQFNAVSLLARCFAAGYHLLCHARLETVCVPKTKKQLVWPVFFLCLMMTAVKCLRRLLCVMTFILTVFRGCKAQTDCECSPQMSFTMWSLIPVNTLSRGQCCWLSRTLVALSCGRPPCGPEQAPIARSKWTCKIAPMEETVQNGLEYAAMIKCFYPCKGAVREVAAS